MPDTLYAFFKGLTDDEAAALWQWLDGEPNAISMMMAELDVLHENLNHGTEDEN